MHYCLVMETGAKLLLFTNLSGRVQRPFILHIWGVVACIYPMRDRMKPHHVTPHLTTS